MRLPNFLIIGAHKAGTASLYHYLKSHPDIFMPKIKEARFFAFNPQNPKHQEKARKAFPITSIEGYSALFDQAKNESAVGEASPNYLTSEYAAKNIFRYIPDAKLIVSLRNPIDRAYSLFLMKYRSAEKENVNVSDYKFSLDDAEQGAYYPKLKVYFDLFDRDQIKIILFEDLVKDTDRVVKEIFKYLNVPDYFSPVVSDIHNCGGIPKLKLIHKISKNKKLTVILKKYFPHSITSILKNIKNDNLREAPQLAKAQRIEAIKLIKDDLSKTENLIQRDLSFWYEI